MSTKNTTGYREVLVEFSNAAGLDIVSQTPQRYSQIDAYKAALGIVERFEAEFAKGNLPESDLDGTQILAVGSAPSQIHVFLLSTNVEDGDYRFLYQETVPTSEDVSGGK